MPNNQDKRTDSGSRRTGPPNAPADPEPPLGRALFRVMRSLVFDDKPVPDLDALPLAQLRLLMSVYYGPNSTMKEFSERLNVSQSTVTQLAERLVKRGMVVRLLDSNDRRVIRLHTSAHGQQLVGQSDAARKTTHRKVWLALAPDEQKLVEQALDLLGEWGEKIRTQEGRPLPALPEPCPRPDDDPAMNLDPQTKPVDLMTRRVRGR